VGAGYPETGDRLAGTTLEPRALASWGYQAVVDLDPEQMELLLDPDRVAAVRHAVAFEFTPSAVQVRRLYRFGHDIAAELRDQGGDASDAEIMVVRPDGAALRLTSDEEPSLARIAPGATASAAFDVNVTPPAPRGANEP